MPKNKSAFLLLKAIVFLFFISSCNTVIQSSLILRYNMDSQQGISKDEITENLEKELIDSSRITYYKAGKIAKSLTYDHTGTIIKGFAREYDKGLVKKAWSYGKKKHIEDTISYEYDKKNRMIKMSGHDWSEKYEYDEKGKLMNQERDIVSKTFYDIKNSKYIRDVVEKREYEYSGLEKREKHYFRAEDYKYFPHAASYLDSFILVSDLIYRYDQSDKIVEEIDTYPQDGTWDKLIYEYDKKGNLIKEIYSDTDGDQAVTDYTYDDNNCLTKQETVSNYNGKEKVTVWAYEYDKWNNWITHSIYLNDTLTRIIERKIEYHK